MNQKHLAEAAARVNSEPIFDELFDALEREAMELCVGAPLKDDDARSRYAAEARAIRNLRSRLRAIATPATGKSAPA